MLIGELIKQLSVFGEGREIRISVLSDGEEYLGDITHVVETSDGIFIQNFSDDEFAEEEEE